MRAIALALIFLFPTATMAAEPFARISIEEEGNAVPGQQIHVLVDVFAPDFFTSPPQFPLFDIPDALVTISDERAQNMERTIDGVQYAGIRKTYFVVAEKPGTFTLPSIRIELGYSVEGKSIKGVAVAPSLSFDVAGGVGDGNGVVLAAKNLTVGQTFDRDPASLQKGDALVRTVVITAEDTQAMMLPELDLGAAAGLTQYAKPPKLLDNIQIDRLHQGSSRTQTIVYTTDAEGSFQIPEVTYPWFDVDAGSRHMASLPAVKVTVSASAQATDRIAPETQEEPVAARHRSTVPALAAIGLALLAAVIWLFRNPITDGFRRLSERWRHRTPSRHARLRQLRRIIRTGQDPAIYAALQDWSRSIGHRSLTEWAESERSPRLQAQVAILQRRLFRSRDVQLDRVALADLVGRSVGKVPGTAASTLPELNPL
jgi:hypothetical protein